MSEMQLPIGYQSGIRYAVPLPYRHSNEAIAWCIETFGESTGLKDRWCALTYTIQFTSIEDKTFYLLRWGGES